MSIDASGKKSEGIGSWFAELDALLRCELTRVSSLRRGGLEINPARLSFIIVLLAMIYGICMGTFAVFRPKGTGWRRYAATLARWISIVTVCVCLVINLRMGANRDSEPAADVKSREV